MSMIKVQRERPRIALIADELTEISLQPDADIVTLTPTNWYWKLTLFRPDFLLVESCWRGHKNSWRHKVARYAAHQHDASPLVNVVTFCRKKGIPTLFWNKEDPVHFDRFIDAARLFDLIYTTDSDCVARYQQHCGPSVKQVATLMFAAQPKLHQVTTTSQPQGIAFFGGFYGDEFPARSQQQSDILRALQPHALTIFDRFWLAGKPCQFPQDLHDHCRPAINPLDIGQHCQQFAINLNFNTVQTSPTMMSRRLFELGAQGCCIVSTPSVAMDIVFEQSVATVSDATSASDICQALLNNPSRRRTMGERAKQITLAQHTWSHRLRQIQRDLGHY